MKQKLKTMNREMIIRSIVSFMENKHVSELKCFHFIHSFLDKIHAMLIHKNQISLSNDEILFIYHTHFTCPLLNIDNKINAQDF